jgi:tetratricopeptide (TPR) repeat protein
MSARRTSRRVLNSTVALAAAGAVALSPVLPLAQEYQPASQDPVAIRIGAAADYTRLEFAGVVGARSRVTVDGRRVVVRIGTTAAPDVSRLKVDPPAGVEAVETRAVQGGTELILTLAEGAEARTGTADGAVFLNLYAPGRVPEPVDDGTPAPVGLPNVPVRVDASASVATLKFDWPLAVGAAVFRRGDTVWIVFDAAAKLDLASTADLGPAGAARWAAGPDYVALRVEAPKTLAVSASVEGGTWTVRIGGDAGAVGGISVDRDPSGEPALVFNMAGSGRAIWLTDPVVGDRFAAVTAVGPAKGFPQRRRTVDLHVLPSAQGLAIETVADDLSIAADGDRVVVSRPRGLILSSPTALLEAAEAPADGAPRKAPNPALILEDWRAPDEGGFLARHRKLQADAAEEGAAAVDDPRAPAEKRLAYARFLVGSGLGYEAVGALNALVDVQPGMLGEAEVRGLRAAARVSVGRLEEAQADLSGAALAADPSAKAWLGLIASRQGDWEEARRQFAAAAGVVDAFPPEWRARFGCAHALAAIELGDLEAARALIAYALSQQVGAAEQLQIRLVQARLFEKSGELDKAAAVFAAVGKAPSDAVAVPARLGVVRIGLARGTMTPKAAAAELETLRWRWRGDATELEVIRTLGQLYLSQGLYREALTALRAAGPRMATMPGGIELQADVQAAFRMLFLEGGADGLQPIQALGLFYDFRELTPIGADGDEMVRRLARRLIDVDLLDQAAELLKYQVDQRLDGVARAVVATDLATVYLMDRQPEAALQAIWSSRTTLLPSELNAERRALEARALMDLGRFDHAVEVLGDDASPAALEVRAEVLWKQENWAGAGVLYERLLGDRHLDATTPLSAADETRLIRAGVGYSLGKDDAGLSRLAQRYAPLVEKARNPDALRIALYDPLTLSSPSGLAAAIQSSNTFTGWVESARTRFRAQTPAVAPVQTQTGGATPAAPPARPAPAGA